MRVLPCRSLTVSLVFGLLVGAAGCGSAADSDLESEPDSERREVAPETPRAVLSLRTPEGPVLNFGFSERESWHFFESSNRPDRMWPTAPAERGAYGRSTSRLDPSGFGQALKNGSSGGGNQNSSGFYSGQSAGNLSFSGGSSRSVGFSGRSRASSGFNGSTKASTGGFTAGATGGSCDLIWICRFVERACGRLPGGAGCQEVHRCRSTINQVSFPASSPAKGWKCFLGSIFKCATKVVDQVPGAKLRSAGQFFTLGWKIGQCLGSDFIDPKKANPKK